MSYFDKTLNKNCFTWHLGGLQRSARVAQPTSSTPYWSLALSNAPPWPRRLGCGGSRSFAMHRGLMLLHPQMFFSTSSSHSTTNIVQTLNLGLKYNVHIRYLCA